MLSHVSHGSSSDVQAPQDALPNAASDKDTENVTTNNSMVMPARSQPEATSETIPCTAYQFGDEVSTLHSSIDGEQFIPSISLDTLENGKDLGIEENSSLEPSVQGCQTSLNMDVSYILESLSDVRGLPGIWTHEYQMGPASFQAQTPSADKIIQGLANTNSSFSDHMQMIRGCLKMQWRKATQIRTNIETPQVILRSRPSCH